jgi:hypothetical protein
MRKKKDNQLVGNIGLFYVCYELSKRGWNCLTTTRNARGVDIVIYSQNGKEKYTIQVKSLSGRTPVPFGSKFYLMSDFVIVCRTVFDKPEVFILTPKEVMANLHEGVKEGHKSYWLQPKSYEAYIDKWNKIGEGFES